MPVECARVSLFIDWITSHKTEDPTSQTCIMTEPLGKQIAAESGVHSIMKKLIFSAAICLHVMGLAKRILMEFEKGGNITATLLDDEAPRTCQAIWNALPVESSVLHAIFAGEEIFFQNYPMGVELGPENQTRDVKPGDVGLNVEAKGFALFYGRARPMHGIDHIAYVNLFARVNEVEKMIEIGKRIRTHGIEKIRISRL